MRYLASRLYFAVTPESNDQDSGDSVSFGPQALNVPITLRIAHYSGATPAAEWWLFWRMWSAAVQQAFVCDAPGFSRKAFPADLRMGNACVR
jgi:hypothetical protein